MARPIGRSSVMGSTAAEASASPAPTAEPRPYEGSPQYYSHTQFGAEQLTRYSLRLSGTREAAEQAAADAAALPRGATGHVQPVFLLCSLGRSSEERRVGKE